MNIPIIQNLDDIRKALHSLPSSDDNAAKKAFEREPQLTKPYGSLGRLEEISYWLCNWQGRHPPTMKTPKAQVFAGNHGVVEQGISAFPAEVTAQMVANFKIGGAAVNQICKTFDIEFAMDALSLDRPTGDFTKVPAMSESECVDAFVYGMGVVEEGIDVLCLGEMGIGNTTSAAALSLALFGGEAKNWTGAGTGISGKVLKRKTKIVAKSVALHNDPDPLKILCCLGGRELAAIAGAVLAARFSRVPILLDGYVSCAAAAPLEATFPGALDHCRVGHVSTEPGHIKLLQRLGQKPFLDLGMRLGETSGAVMAVAVLKAAVACHTGMATFDEANVSEKSTKSKNSD
jgi:nicotinate-nucleotide--dimethylbenzimidazole phosphoribosyltransferase